MMIPVATTPTNTAINCIFKTFLRMIVSGKDKPITLIINASTVPSEAPFSSNAWTMGMIPAGIRIQRYAD